MKYLFRNVYLIFLLTIFLQIEVIAYSKEIKFKHTSSDIYNYFSGIVALNEDDTTRGFNYLKKVQSLKDKHFNFNVHYLRTLVLLDKFDEAITFAKKVWVKDQLFFEADLLLGLDYFLNKDYSNAQKYFVRLNKISINNLYFEDFLGNALISWIEASRNNRESSFQYLSKIPQRYENLKKIQNSFLQCYYDLPDTETSFKDLIGSEEYSFARYNFFLVNYLLSKNKNLEAKKIIKNSLKTSRSNLIIKQTNNLIETGKSKKIIKFFSCKHPKDNIAEIFYVIANLYSTEKDYKLSNFYLKISLFLNDKFLPNKTLLAENFFNQEKYELSKKIYNSVRSIGSVYSWFSSKSIASILSITEGEEEATTSLINDFNLLPNINFEHYYEFANFHKNKENYKESIKYYSLALKEIRKQHPLIPKILERRGTSYERSGDWEKAEKDLIKSLEISPDQPYVLNYLAYSWIDRGMNIEKSLEMLKEATKLRKNDGYIIDSLGWGYYMKKDYLIAEKFLQRAVELLPMDPVINDHYADALWMLNKDIQARYIWKHVLSLDDVEKETKDNIKEKLIFGVKQKI